ncbi:alpha/beta fold hydrolase [Cupriavidus metallidurans]|jgi:2-hydroxymuconate-semialdehyde hydrolase|uniref:alpha/beta fold hydrolase n=1 Tax=Cupriavidus metallidurans TaxID=119219 RepID=UPI0007637F00|nr:alpha/beta hydrolase [Cupriavidus metallidurans]KWW37040.1 2-hydroxymuconate semialdehyde hydrolase [Cupriavidus metallidurans]
MQRLNVDAPGIPRTSVLDAGQGRPTILIHGTSSSAEMGWAQLLPRLAAKRRCLAFDMVGAGQTEDPGGPIALTTLVEQVRAVADLAGDGKPLDLVGYSLGAVVAAVAAAAMPDRVRRLILLGGWVQSSRSMCVLFDLWAELSRTDKHQLARLLLVNGVSDTFFQANSTEAIQTALDRIANLLSAGGDRQAELDATIDIRAELPKIRAQTLVIGMQQDRLVPPAHCRDLAAGIAGARYEQIDCGHLVTLEQPGALLDLVESHLDSPTGHCHEERHGAA